MTSKSRSFDVRKRNTLMSITITAFERSPDGGKGLARDTRVRWALEEAGQPYEVRYVSFQAMKEPAHLRLHPFGQIPTYEEGELALFETGAIVLPYRRAACGAVAEGCRCTGARDHVDVRRAQLGRAVHPGAGHRPVSGGRQALGQQRLPLVMDRIRQRLDQLSTRLGDADVAGWRFQRGRPDDGLGAAADAAVGHPGRIPHAGRVCRAW